MRKILVVVAGVLLVVSLVIAQEEPGEDLEDENGYKRKVSWVDKENYLCYKVEFYDLEDEIFKTQLIKEFQKQSNGKYFAYYMEMYNEQSGRRSVMTTDSFKLGSDLEEDSFSPNTLEK